MKMKIISLPILAVALLASVASGQIVVESFVTQGFGSIAAVDQASPYTIAGFDVGAGSKIVVSFSQEGPAGRDATVVTFGGAALTKIVSSTDLTGGEQTEIFFLDGVSGIGDIVIDSGTTLTNGPGVYAAALSGAEAGFETFGSFGDGQQLGDTLTGTLTGVSAGAYVIAQFGDQGNTGDVLVTGDLVEVGEYNNPPSEEEPGQEIGSAIAATASGFGTGSDLTVGFSDTGDLTKPFQNRSNFTWASFTAAAVSPVILGDVDLSGTVDFLDISPFISVLSGGTFQAEADCDESGTVDFLDISPFIGILSGS